MVIEQRCIKGTDYCDFFSSNYTNNDGKGYAGREFMEMKGHVQ
jgi:hypothetical protein